MIGRRGPAHAKFTTKELRELGELAGVEVPSPAGKPTWTPSTRAGPAAELAESDRHVRGNSWS